MTRAPAAGVGAPTAQTPELTDAQRADARTWMQAARVWTIERYPYLDTALTSMLLVESPGLGTVAVDARWRLYYDPARTLGLQQHHGIEALASDWIHEVMHLLRDHCARWVKLCEPLERHRVFNVASDAHVNADVVDLGLPILPTDVTFDLLPEEAGCNRLMTTEEVYRRLLDQAIEVSDDCGSGTGGDRRPWELPITDDQDDGSLSSDDAIVVLEDSARKVRAAAASSHVPAAIRTWANEFLQPTVDWRIELRSAVSRRLGQIAGITDYTFTRPSRRRVPGFTLPGMVGPQPPRVAAVIDTSGSMTPSDLKQCLADLLGLVRATGGSNSGITVMSVDHRILEISTIRRPSQVASIRLRGGGGTDMSLGLVACGELPKPPDVVVVLTDGYTGWPPRPVPGLESALVIALLTQPETASSVPAWIRTITATGPSGQPL